MPIYKKIQPNAQTTVLIWHINEQFAELKNAVRLQQQSETRIQNMQSETHQKGFLSIRCLLQSVGYTDFDLFYTADGKPHLKDGKRISITHSFDYSGIIISDYAVGIDIEKNREKIKIIAPKFIQTEWDFLEPDSDIEMLTVIWGAKESLYKIHPDGGLLFKQHLPIDPFKINDGKTTGWIKKDNFYEKFNIYFELFNGYSMVYAVN